MSQQHKPFTMPKKKKSNTSSDLATATAHLIGLYILRAQLSKEAESQNHSLLPLTPEFVFTDWSHAPEWSAKTRREQTEKLSAAIEHVEWEVNMLGVLAGYMVGLEKLEAIAAGADVGGGGDGHQRKAQEEWKQQQQQQRRLPSILVELKDLLRGAATFTAVQREAVLEELTFSWGRIEGRLASMLEEDDNGEGGRS